ncbi:MAG TPA: glycosyltransferase family 4 protein [Solirubrobacteraceae bacterium]|nr:glycosyltransferase family 4 protein [Solirubrobacteraceae bacterium]
MRRGRVLFLCHGHPGERPGGAENYAHDLHLALRGSGEWEPIFLARTGPPQSRSEWQPGTPRIRPIDATQDEYLLHTEGYDFDWLLGTMRHDKALYTTHLRDFLLATKPDVVHFQHTLFIGYDAIRMVRRTMPDVPIVYTLHEFLPICHHKGQMVRATDGEPCAEETPRRCHECYPHISPDAFALRKRYIQSQLALVDMFVAPSAVVHERFVRWGIPRERILLEDYGRPPQTSANTERIPPHRTLGFFGQLNPYKGIDVLLEAIGHLASRPEGHRPHLHVHGANLDLQDRAFRERVRALLDSCAGLVTSFGPYPPHRVGELMAAVDWVVVPSTWWENSPLVIQEAFAHRRPVICSDIGGMAEKVTDGRDGLLFPVGDAMALATTIRRAIETDGLWERLRAGVPATHVMDDHLAALGAAYDRLLNIRRAECAV